MLGNFEILGTVILQKTEAVRVKVVKRKRINIRIFMKPIIWKFELRNLKLIQEGNLFY